MNQLLHLLLGTGIGLLSVLPPGLLNVTASKISAKHQRRAAFYFSLGATLVFCLQCYIGLLFSKFLLKNPDLLKMLEYVAIGIFILLSIVFFQKARNVNQKAPAENKDPKKHTFFLNGILLSSLNMFPIPFYVALSAFLASKNILSLQSPFVQFFILGCGIGTLAMLSLYALFAKSFLKDSVNFNRNSYYLLSGLTLFVAIFTLIKNL